MVKVYAQPLSNQARGNGVNDAAHGNRAKSTDRCRYNLVVRGAVSRQGLQKRLLDFKLGVASGIELGDDLFDKCLVLSHAFKVKATSPI